MEKQGCQLIRFGLSLLRCFTLTTPEIILGGPQDQPMFIAHVVMLGVTRMDVQLERLVVARGLIAQAVDGVMVLTLKTIRLKIFQSLNGVWAQWLK